VLDYPTPRARQAFPFVAILQSDLTEIVAALDLLFLGV
jgi:hypothetical protein